MAGNISALAERYQMRGGGGVAYGLVDGYPVTLRQDKDSFLLCLSTTVPDPAQRAALEDTLRRELCRACGVTSLVLGEKFLQFRFPNGAGVARNADVFLHHLTALLRQCGGTDGGVCSACGGALGEDAQWKLIDGTAHRFHPVCAQRLREQLDGGKAKGGSWLWGTVGALLGAALGGLLWGGVLVMGYLMPVLAFLVGWLARFGCDLLHGREHKAKGWLLAGLALLTLFAAYFIAMGVAVTRQLAVTPGGVVPPFNRVMAVLWRSFFSDKKALFDSLLSLFPSVLFALVGSQIRNPRSGGGSGSKMKDLR